MGFEQVFLADTKIEKPAPVPVGTYVFQLQPGANYRENPYRQDNTGKQVTELNVRFDVVEGDFAGRPVFAAYPDPTVVSANGKSMAWSQQALKKLEIALGVDALPGETNAAYLNRVALNGNARVTASILPGKNYKDNKTGEEKQQAPSFGIFTVAPAA